MTPPDPTPGSGQLLEAILDSIQDGISVLDSSYTIVRVNQAMRKWYPDQLPLEGKRCFEVHQGRTTPCDPCPSRRAMDTRTTEREEVDFHRADGGRGVLEIIAHPLPNEGGGPGGVVEVVRDISERKREERIREEREELYRALFEANSSVMLLIDPDTGSIRDANESAAAYYRCSREDLRALSITEINALSQEEIREEMGRARRQARGYFNFRHRLTDGEVRDVEVYSGPVRVKGSPLLCSVIHDVSARKAAEEEREDLIEELQRALSEVRTLRGFIPICSSCRKVRDVHGLWDQMEVYLRDHSDAEFTHGLCPDCMRKLYPEYVDDELLEEDATEGSGPGTPGKSG